MRRGILIGALVSLTVAGGALAGASDAGAVVVRTPSGHFLGITPKPGVPVSSLSGARVPRAATRTSGNGNLDYNGGPVLHSSAPYLIFWDPSGTGIPAASRSLLTQYFSDVAADSGNASNVYAVNRQFPDGSGIADYKQTFGSGQAISDTQAFPSRDLAGCPDVSSTYPTCVTDAQIEAELSRLISADSLPKGTGDNAPIYFVVTPGDTNVCFDSADCADSTFCAYHSSSGSGASTVLYASIPMFFNGASGAQNPKTCQSDGNSKPQEPNGDIADVAIKYLSHEDSETITDPTGLGWWDTATGNEDGDNCNFYGSYDPAGGSNPNAFAPTLGGSATAGTLYNQLIDGHHYYTQSEWSNGDINCELKPSSGTLTAQFSAPGSAHAGSPLSFDPTASTSSNGISSVAWDFGDGGSAFAAGGPAVVSHTFASDGTFDVKLTLVDDLGNVSSVTHSVMIGPIPSATFIFAPTAPVAGDAVGFNGGGSSDPNAGATLTSYSWNFGDGSPAVSGIAPSHTYAHAGNYSVRLTVTDNLGLSDTSVQTVSVAADEVPTARLTRFTAHPETGLPAAFDGSSSNDPDGSIVAMSWDFGDGSAAATGASAQHVYTKAGTYTVVLTVQDSGGQAASTTESIKVAGPGISASLHGRSLRVSVDQPGTVSVKGKRKQLGRAGTVSFKVALTRAQRRRLHAHHSLKLKLPISFAPLLGQTTRTTVTVKLR